MIYAVLGNEQNGFRAINQIIDVEVQIGSIAELMQLPAFADEVIDFNMGDLEQLPHEGIDFTYHYNVSTGQFEKAPEPHNSQLTKLQLMQRLTPQEQVLLFFPDDAEGVPTNARIPLKLFAKQIELANFIDIDHPDTVAALQQLEDLGLLNQGRVSAIREIHE